MESRITFKREFPGWYNVLVNGRKIADIIQADPPVKHWYVDADVECAIDLDSLYHDGYRKVRAMVIEAIEEHEGKDAWTLPGPPKPVYCPCGCGAEM